MAKLILIKHSQPVLDPDVPAPRWVLSDEGVRRCEWLAGALKAEGVSRLYSSMEPKALETAAIVSTRVGLPVEPRVGLHENDRTGMGFVEEQELQRLIREFFKRPRDAVLGHETADAAFRRFALAIGGILGQAHGRNVAVIAHGTVITLFVGAHNAVDRFAFWRELTVPSYVVLDSQSLALVGALQTFPKLGPKTA